MIDIVIGTYNRQPILARTLEHIRQRTRAPYRVHVVDDASTDGTSAYLDSMGDRVSVTRRGKRAGIAWNMTALLPLTRSNPLCFTDDDVLCPDVDPDWLSRLVQEMADRPSLGILALNNPQASIQLRGDRRRMLARDGAVRFCKLVGATFALIRREVLEDCGPIPEGDFGRMKWLCLTAATHGWHVGYLAETYCQHIGVFSQRRDLGYSAELAAVMPLNKQTLEPPDAFKG